MTAVLPSAGRVWRQARRIPATISYLAALWTVGLATGSVARGPSPQLSRLVGAGLPSLGHGRWWTPLTAGPWASGLGGYLAVTVLGLLILGPAERRMGVTRTFATLLVSQVAGLLLAAGLVRLGGLAGEPWLGSLSGETALGAVPGLLGVGLALSCTLSPLWRRRLRLLVAAAVTVGALYIGHLEQVAQACGAAAGLVIGMLTGRSARSLARWRGSDYEVRLLVGLLVAVSAVGGILAALITTAEGPMSLFSLLFATPGPESHSIVAACPPAGAGAICRGLGQQQLYAQWPGVLVRVGPALLLLLSAEGLRRGRRLAWRLAVAINLIVLGGSIWITGAVQSGSGVHIAGLDSWAGAVLLPAEAMLLPAVTLVVLLMTRRRFDLTAGRQAARRLTATLAGTLAAGCGTFLLSGYLLAGHFSPRPALGALVRDLPARFLANMPFSARFLPVDLAGRLAYIWVFAACWLVVLGALTAFFLHTPAYRDAEAASQARTILARGGSTLSYMTTWPGNRYWISPDGRAAIAYRAVGSVAVTVGEPYGDQAALDTAITEFARFCEHRGLQPCLYSVTAQARDVTHRLGWKSVQVAEDTLLPLAGLQFTGKKWQDVRTALNKAARENITAEWWRYPDAPPELASQIRRISEKWAAARDLPEMGFTLGGLDELNDPNVRCLIAVGADGTVHGVTSWMPVYASGHPVGWTLDFMRRSTEPGTFPGVMEFLIATAAAAFRDEGARFVSLSGAPLARLDRGEQPSALQRVLDKMATTMEPVYGFQSLLHFKAKFQPDYQPLYLAYPDSAALGSIAIAISRAYLPHLTSRQALHLLGSLSRRHHPRSMRSAGDAVGPSAA